LEAVPQKCGTASFHSNQILSYDAGGMRIRKTVDWTDYTYYTYHGKNLVHLKKTGGTDMHFYYDAQNRPSVVNYNGNHYAYVYNLQGDVMALLDNTGAKVVEYAYNAWGKPLYTSGSMASTLGVLNPFRYRGYIYDEETGYYYLRSRYYYPNRCRFINADIHLGVSGELLSHSLYSYCQNSPIVYLDFDGNVRLYGIEIAYYGYFHKTVQDDIAKLNPGIKTEQNPSPDSKSRIDLKLGNEIFEIKPKNAIASALGEKQLKRYLEEGNGELIRGTTSLTLPKYEPLIVGDWCITLDVEQNGALITYSVNKEKMGKTNSKEIPVIRKDQKFELKNTQRVVQALAGGVAIGLVLVLLHGSSGKGVTCACF